MTVLSLPAVLPEIDWVPAVDDLPINLLPVEGLPNAALAYAVLDQIDLCPQRWDQNIWLSDHLSCGTVACFAGWACLLVGDQPGFSQDTVRIHVPGAKARSVSVMVRARELLNIKPRQAEFLFQGWHNRQTLENSVAMFFGPRP